jgi:hypothetical protein
VRLLTIAASVVCVAAVLSACGGGGKGDSVSVFDVKAGECFDAPSKVSAELSTITRIPCGKEHLREAYAVATYQAAAGASDAYPGADALSTYSKGVCAQQYRPYVGVDYLDSALFFTYLFPSARSWEQDHDRTVVCFVTSSGEPLTGSVKNSKR